MARQVLPQTTRIEAYWLPGCSSCLRMKEFLTTHGIEFTAVNAALEPDRARVALSGHGVSPPAVVKGDHVVHGMDLVGIAELVGLDYTPPVILPPAVLAERFDTVMETTCALLAQLSSRQLAYRTPQRDRSLADVAGHIGAIMLGFLELYDSDTYDPDLEYPAQSPADGAELIAACRRTQKRFAEWWRRFGFDDPLDRVVDSPWGAQTMHEMLERAVWHPMQHCRQLTMFVERFELRPARRLTPDDFAGLPLPDGIFSGGEDD